MRSRNASARAPSCYRFELLPLRLFALARARRLLGRAAAIGLAALLRHRLGLPAQRATGRRLTRLPLQRLLGSARPLGRHLAALLLRLPRRRLLAAATIGELHAGTPRLGQPDRDRLLRALRAVLAFANVMDLLAHELARLRAG